MLPSLIRLGCGAAAALLLLSASRVVGADSEAGLAVGAFRGVAVQEVHVRGVPAALADSIKLGLELIPRGGLFSREKPLLYETPLARDIDRVRLFLARHGYPHAAVEPEITPNKKSRTVTIEFHVESGPPVRIGEIRVSNVPPAFEKEAVAKAKAAEHQRFNDDSVQRLRLDVNGLLLGGGHARSTVRIELVPVDSTLLDLEVIANPGAVYEFRSHNVQGTREDLVQLAKKASGMSTGEIYSPEALRRAHDRLRLLDLFRQIRVEPIFPDDSIGVSTEVRPFDTRLSLADRAFRSVEVGVGYWTDDLLRAQVRWQHRNLFQRGRGFRIRGFYSRFSQEVASGLWWPATPWSVSRMELRGTVTWEQENSYHLEEQQVDYSILFRPSLKTTYRTGLSFSRVDVDVLTTETTAFREQGGFVTLLFANWAYETTDDRLDPTRGWITSFGTEASLPQLLSDAPYWKVEGSGVAYVPIPLRSVLVTRASGGWAEPTGDAVDLLPNKRFYAGGLNSMRGFKRRYLGPLDIFGSPIGGRATVEGAIEVRFPIWKRFGGALFTDAGQVWSRTQEIKVRDIEVAVGGGLMVKTPIGPLRVDVGYRLTNIVPRQPDTVVHLAVGHPF